MAVGDHLAVYFNHQWRHAIQVSQQHVVTLPLVENASDESSQIASSCSAAVRMDLKLFLEKGQLRTITSDCDLQPERIAQRANAVLAGKIQKRFGGDTEHFATWCRTNASEPPTDLANRQLERELKTAELQHPLARQILQTLSIDSVKDKAAVLSRLALPWMMIGDVAEVGIRLASAMPQKPQGKVTDLDEACAEKPNTKLTTKPTKKLAAAAGAAGATALGAAAGGPTMAVATLASWLLSKRTSDNAIERGKDLVCEHARTPNK